MIVVKLFAKVLSIFYIIMCHVLGLVYTNNFSSDELFGWFADIFFCLYLICQDYQNWTHAFKLMVILLVWVPIPK